MDRINAFATTLNSSDRSGINSNFDPGLSGLPSTAVWTTDFPIPGTLPTDIPYSITLLDYSDPANVTASIFGPTAFYTNAGGPPASAVFSMVKIGSDWYIEKLTVGTIAIP